MSTVTNSVDLSIKLLIKAITNVECLGIDKEKIKKNHYFEHILHRSKTRCFIALIPIIGNIMLASYDIYKNCKKGKEELVTYHLGGRGVLSADLKKEHKGLTEDYFYEGIPVKIKREHYADEETIFVYKDELKAYLDLWMEEVKTGKSDMTFQDYLSEQFNSDPTLVDKIYNNRVRYFSNHDLAQTKVHNIQGQCCQIGLDSNDDELKRMVAGSAGVEYIFVIIGEANLFVAKEVNQEDLNNIPIVNSMYAARKAKTHLGRVQHSSFTRGGNVLSAGSLLLAEDGSIESISDGSGHYHPQAKEMAICIQYLLNQGFDLSKTQITNTNQACSALEWYKTEGEALIDQAP